jgi:hypothetical protein
LGKELWCCIELREAARRKASGLITGDIEGVQPSRLPRKIKNGFDYLFTRRATAAVVEMWPSKIAETISFTIIDASRSKGRRNHFAANS